MNQRISKRVLEVSEYILRTNETVREIAKVFGVSKSTIHKDLTERLQEISKVEYDKVQNILLYHKKVRHIRGGLATKRKYKILYQKHKI